MTEINTVFDVKANLAGVLNTKLEGANVELVDSAKDVLVDFLISNGQLTVENVLDLDGFTHFDVPEGETAPVKTLLVGPFIVYLYEKTRQVYAHQQDYNEYLEDNDLYEDEYSYGQYLEDNELVETFDTVETYYVIRSVSAGETYLTALREKEELAKRLEVAIATEEKLKPIISANFLPLA